MSRRSRLEFPKQDIMAMHRRIEQERVTSIVGRMDAAFKEQQKELLRVNQVLNTFKYMLAAVVKRYGPLDVTEDEVQAAGEMTAVDCVAGDCGVLTLTAKELPVAAVGDLRDAAAEGDDNLPF
jgi:hypothetical protein